MTSLQPEGLTLFKREERASPDGSGILPLAKSTDYPFDGKIVRKWFGWVLPGHGSSYFDCGSWRLKGCLNTEDHVDEGLFEKQAGKVFVKVYPRSCLRAECPICYEKWAGKEAGKIEWRLKAWSGRGEPIHVVISPSKKDVHLMKFTELRQKCYKIAQESGFLGGSSIFHPYRQNESSKKWYFSPHFHLIGFGWIKGTAAGYRKHGWVVKNVGVRKTVSGTALYQLSHCGIHSKFHSVTWFGKLSYNRLKVPVKPVEHEVCPQCGKRLRVLWYFGDLEIPEVEGEYWFPPEGFRYKPRRMDYG